MTAAAFQGSAPGRMKTAKPVLRLPSGQRPMPRCGTGPCQRAMRARFPKRPSAARRATAPRARSAGRREIELEEQGGGGERNVNLHAPPPALTSNSENGVGSEYGRNSCKFVKIRGHPAGVCPQTCLSPNLSAHLSPPRTTPTLRHTKAWNIPAGDVREAGA